MSIVSKAIDYSQDQDVKNHLINVNRPYNVEKRRLKSLVDFGVTSQYMSNQCLKEFKNREHGKALIMNRGRN